MWDLFLLADEAFEDERVLGVVLNPEEILEQIEQAPLEGPWDGGVLHGLYASGTVTGRLTIMANPQPDLIISFDDDYDTFCRKLEAWSRDACE